MYTQTTLWYCWAQALSALYEAELIRGRASLTILARLPSQPTAAEEGREEEESMGQYFHHCLLWVLRAALKSTLLHDAVRDGAAFKIARLKNK